MPPRNRKLERRPDTFAPPRPTAPAGEVGRLFGLSKDFPVVLELPLARIRRNPDQPRRRFDEAELEALADSIREHGLKYPVLVKDEGEDRYLLVGGERRLRAMERLGRDTIFAIVTTGDTDEVALLDNAQRVDLDAVELAQALARLVERHGYTHARAGRVVGLDEATVSRVLRIRALPDDVLASYAEQHRRVPRSVLEEVAAADGAEAQRALWRRATGGATVRDLREARKETVAAVPWAAGRALGNAIRGIARSVRTVAQHRDALDEQHRKQLEALRGEIDRLLGRPE